MLVVAMRFELSRETEYSAALSASVYQDMKGFHRLDSTLSHQGSIGNVSWHVHVLTLAKAPSPADDVTQVGFGYKRVDSINGLVHWKVQTEWTIGSGVCWGEMGQWWHEFERYVFSWAPPLFLHPICHEVSHCVLWHSSYHNALPHHTGPEGTEPNGHGWKSLKQWTEINPLHLRCFFECFILSQKQVRTRIYDRPTRHR